MEHKPRKSHGQTKGGRTRFYRIRSGIQGRCNRITDYSYNNYGGRGIKCEWLDFYGFCDDMYESYLDHVDKFGEKETSIDRINANGSYCKKNCRRATCKEQANNRRNNIGAVIKNNRVYSKSLYIILGKELKYHISKIIRINKIYKDKERRYMIDYITSNGEYEVIGYTKKTNTIRAINYLLKRGWTKKEIKQKFTKKIFE